ncbi:class II aldolase and Adducin domain-containing protein [Thozetella sp. PMI_491]|nr:class II aldolase and Adducin domain-containing protein [Thozetella sp. PMI_491]
MSRSIAPGTISSAADLQHYLVKDAAAVDNDRAGGYAERRIHSEIYKRHAHVQAVVHSRSEAVVPYSISEVPLRSCYHMAGFLGANGPPVFDTAHYLQPDDQPDMLVRNEHLGAALAACFDGGNAVVLMHGHGFTAVAGSIESAVLRAMYTQKNATILASALSLRADTGLSTAGLKTLTHKEAGAAATTTESTIQRPWRLWVREVESSNLYSNEG